MRRFTLTALRKCADIKEIKMPIATPETVSELVGEKIGTSDWLEIDQDRINQFADVTEDHQFIHIDPEAAAKTPFGTTIAHGFLSLSML